ncbi:thioredoxin domain-containing protein [Psychroflexus sp. ALD_RP9]|uniref:thioredoxin domain-containing protein n=1 Tax=Psychroflexus sp. ALD_RP9 TaxID=2777186 RepID=UPI001F5D66B2|nr:thioredoxin domain-containing protein [Psychroflexus sp. ALD_RP9]
MNLLHKASSPYLLQHRDNPVHWREWNAESLALAKKENKPLLISIGYAACHWCHVMAHESFEDQKVAEVMNAHFICIKVDREERPDVDQIYMDAAQILTGRGGWPLNAFAFPDGKPFYAATYFPKDNWLKVLKNVAKAYDTQQEQLKDTALKLTRGIQDIDRLDFTENNQAINFSTTDYQDLLGSWQRFFDSKHGGFKGAPKFAMPSSWQFLLQYHKLTENKEALEQCLNLLDHMIAGGIYDQIHGGFARYSVDERWFAPHFEKMLYDNAQMISLLANAYKITQKPSYKTAIEQSLDFVNNWLSDKNGGFYSAVDADSEGREGAFYTYSYHELEEALTSNEFEIAKSYFNLKQKGNWEEGQNIIYTAQSISKLAEAFNLTEGEFVEKLNLIRSKIKTLSDSKPRPEIDTKILCSWNAMMLKAYVDAYQALGLQTYLDKAKANAAFIQKELLSENQQLFRNYKDGQSSITGFLEDYAWLSLALISLYEATLTVSYLELAKKLIDKSIADFYDADLGLFYYTSTEAEALIARKIEVNDNVIPSSNSVMLQALFKLHKFYNANSYKRIVQKMLAKVSPKLHKSGPYLAHWAIVVGYLTHPFAEVVTCGSDYAQKHKLLLQHYNPNAIFLGGTTEDLALMKGKTDYNQIFVCVDQSCQQPANTVEEALKQLKALY